MAYKVNFIEVEPEKPCCYCGRKKLKGSERFYKVFVGESDFGMTVCEICKGGFLTRAFEDPERTYVAHLAFYVRHAFLELEEKLPSTIAVELDSAMSSYEDSEYSTCFRNIGLVAEWITERLFVKKFGDETANEDFKWENRLGKLLDLARRNKKIPEETIVYQLFSLKWLRNRADHPSEYKITGEDARIGLTSLMYLLHQSYLHNLI